MPAALPLPEPPLRDGRATLRPWTDDDLADLVAGSTDPLVRHYRFSVPGDADQGRRWLATTRADRERGERLELAICDDADPTALGSISLWGIHHRNRDAMMSWWMGPRGRGRGLAAGAVRLLAAWSFQELGMARIAAQIEEGNAASRALAERCGFTLEGRLRSYQRQHDGSRVDCVSYSLLRDELSPGGRGPARAQRQRIRR